MQSFLPVLNSPLMDAKIFSFFRIAIDDFIPNESNRFPLGFSTEKHFFHLNSDPKSKRFLWGVFILDFSLAFVILSVHIKTKRFRRHFNFHLPFIRDNSMENSSRHSRTGDKFICIFDGATETITSKDGVCKWRSSFSACFCWREKRLKLLRHPTGEKWWL